MEELQQFISDARGKGWEDSHIKHTLVSSGWPEGQVEAAMSGLTVPVPGQQPITQAVTHDDKAHGNGRPSITALQAALQHVLLWVFTFTSTIMINVVAFALFAGGSSSSEVLLTFVVLELVTFTPFLLLYLRYLRRRRNEADLMTGRVWSIITIVFHSIGLLGAIVSFILVLLLVHNSAFKAGVISSATIGIMDALVVAAYVIANFSKVPLSQGRRKFLTIFPAALFVLIATLALFALLHVGPLRADDQTKQNLATTVNKVHQYVSTNKHLPDNLTALNGAPSGVTYQRLSADTYNVCAAFKVNHDNGGYNGTDGMDDSYVDASEFDTGHAGNNCWKFQNYDVQTVPVNPCLKGTTSCGCGTSIDYMCPLQSN